MKKVIYHVFGICICCLIFSHSTAQSIRDSLSIQVSASGNTPLQGAYVVNKTKHYLVATTDKEGKCSIPLENIAGTDSIQFAFMGFRDTIVTWSHLQQNNRIILFPKTISLQEVQIKGINSGQLLHSLTEQLSPIKHSYPLNFHGNAHYTKITRCNSTAVEFRDEIGCLLTSGNVRYKEKWDLRNHDYFIPVYTARSYNLTTSGDTLKIPSMTGSKLEYDAGNMKIFNVIRSIEIWGPLFSKLKYYDIELTDSDDTYYTFSFYTKKEYYPQKIKILCRGKILVGKNDHRLKQISMNYLDYHFYKLTNMTRANSPFITKALLEFAYNNSTPYIKTCQVETIWKYNFDEHYGSIEKPSRRNPAKAHLVEQEYITFNSLHQIPKEKQEKYLLQKVVTAACNPRGEYQPDIFRKRKLTLNEKIAISEVEQFQKIEEQFQHNSNRWYYPESKFSSLPLKMEQLNIPVSQFILQTRNEIIHDFFE